MLVGGFYQAVVWPTPDRYELLEHGNYPYAVALGIDNTGMITGSTQSDGAALVWRTAASRPENVARLACEGGGAPADLCLPGAPGFEYRGLARGANARGQIAGTAFVGVGPSGAGTPVAVVFSLAPTSAAGTLLADRNSGRCLDVLGESRDRGTPLAIYDCHGRANQRFTYPAVGETGEIRVYGAEGGALCLDAQGGSDADGTPVLTWSCHGGANQRWTRTAAGEFRGIGGKCLDVVGAGTANLTGVWLWTCYGGANQRWDARAAAQIAAR